MVSKSIPVIVIMGPTASGKTDLSYKIADALPSAAEIISVDSAMIYRGMDIGTAKPSKELQKQYAHHLIDIIDPNGVYSVADFIRDANKTIAEIHQRQAIPIMVGGTMMYHYFFQHGLSSLPKANIALRSSYEEKAKLYGWHSLHDQLAVVDPQTAKIIHPNDGVRISRALEVYDITGLPLSLINKQDESQHAQLYDFKTLVLTVDDRATLHKRIAERFNHMLDLGLEYEVKNMLQAGYLSNDSPASRCVGYRQMLTYLQNTIDYKEMCDRGIIATRQLAKRQITWIRRYFSTPDIKQMNYDALDMEQLMQFFSC